jgi:hypothetical protein
MAAAKKKPKKKTIAKAKAKAKTKTNPKARRKAVALSKVKTKKKKSKANAVSKKPNAKAKPKAKAKAATKKPNVVAIAAAPDSDSVPATKPEAGSLPPSSPSQRVLAGRADAPTERSLTDEEREAMEKVAHTARQFIGVNDGSAPTEVVRGIASFVEDVRNGRTEEPASQDVRLGLGVLWGEQLRVQVGWRWVHLTYPDAFASYALVPDDRAFACFPLNRVPEALRPSATNTSSHVFDSILENALPTRRANTYLVIG